MRMKASLLYAFCLSLLMMAGCATTVPPKAPEFGGEWTPLNRFEDDIQVLPLRTRYSYGALPLDVSLAQMLERWARDSGVALDQRCDNDFSLPSQLLTLRAPSLSEGLTRVSEVYQQHRLRLSIDPERGAIVMRCDPEPVAPEVPNETAPTPVPSRIQDVQTTSPA